MNDFIATYSLRYTHAMRRTFLPILLSCFLLASCGPKEPLPLPQGEQMIYGVLFPAELSRIRRGTHIIAVGGESLYYVESKSVNLRMYEQKLIELTGHVEYNTDPLDLPVLVVSSVAFTEEERKEWTFNRIGITVSLPPEWDTLERQGGFEAIVFTDATKDPIITINRVSGELEELDHPFPILLDGIQAQRQIDESTGSELIRFKQGEEHIHLLFTQPLSGDPALKAEWLTIIHNIEIIAKMEDPDEREIQRTASGAGVPCGGTAGVLCPPGLYCDITDLNENIGVCRTM